MKKITQLLLLLALSSCANLYHVQVSDVDGKIVSKGRKFEILVSETGVNLKEATDIAKALTNHGKTKTDMGEAQQIISMFQMGPRTGQMVFNDKFTDHLISAIKSQCPKGKVSSLMSVREMRKYPVVSGEIVKIIGYCLPKERS